MFLKMGLVYNLHSAKYLFFQSFVIIKHSNLFSHLQHSCAVKETHSHDSSKSFYSLSLEDEKL